MKFTIYPVNMLDPIQKCSGYSPLKNKSKVWVIFDMISVKVRWEQSCRWNWSVGYKCTKTGIFCCTESITMTLKIMCTYAHYVTLGSRCKIASNHRVTDLEKCPVLTSKNEAPTPLSVDGPSFISSLLFPLSLTLLGAWRFSLFRSIYSSFHNRLDLIREPAFYWVFYFIFPIYPCLFHHM